jgi:hypothetical protein
MVDQQRRCYRITIRFLPAEHQLIAAAAAKAEVCLSAYARQVLVGARPPRSARRPGVEKRLLTQALDRLGTIGSGLRAIARAVVANPAGAIMPVVERDLSRSLLELRDARHDLLRALGRRKPSP